DDRNDFRGAGVIGLVKYLCGGSHDDALDWIAAQKGPFEVHRCLAHRFVIPMPNTNVDDAQLGNLVVDTMSDFRLPEIDGDKETRATLEKFLVHLGFKPEVTSPLLEDKKIYASRINGRLMAVFFCRNAYDPTGAELVGITEEFSGMHVFSNRYEGAFSIGKEDDKRIIVCQDAIDAISYKQLHPDDTGLIISSAGVTQCPPFVDDLIEKNWDVQISFGNHEAGKAFAEKIQERLPAVDLVLPDRESWHAVLTGTNTESPSPRG
ncbi:MAG: toprim domain-containing protein, partial [Desulfobacteraceae bacterium]|nr:toprim domain-containing protein [Desulfobacteraceae bacterium]